MTKQLSLVVPAEGVAALSAIDQEELDAIVNPLDDNLLAPAYQFGYLPKVYEDFVADKCHTWGCDPSLYAGAFLTVHAANLHASVRVETNPFVADSDVGILDFCLFVGGTGVNKSGPHKDLLKYTKGVDAALQVTEDAKLADPENKQVYKKSNWMSTASIEMLVQQQAVNAGFPLVIATDEFYNFLLTAVAHHSQSGYVMLSEFLNTLFDGGSYKKKLKDKTNTEVYAESLHTSILCATTLARLSVWKHYKEAILDGFFGRFTIATATRANSWPMRPEQGIPHAQRSFDNVQTAMRSMKDYLFRLDPALRDRWVAVNNKKKDENERFENNQQLGILAWNSKYQKRVMRIAAVMQMYKYIAGGLQDHELGPEVGDKVTPRTQKIVTITLDTMVEAFNFHEQVLLPQQLYFHSIMAESTEFREPTKWFFYKILATDMTSIGRDELCGTKGPLILRGDGWELDAKRERYVSRLLDMGLIKPSPKARNAGTAKATQLSRYDIPPGVRVKFADLIPEAKGEYGALLTTIGNIKPISF